MGAAVPPPTAPGAAGVAPAELRLALGAFATGVTVITARAADGRMTGVTANSFNSVSLDPPLVLWSLAVKSFSLPLFTEATHWGVHILSADQQWLSDRFARGSADKFAGLEHDCGLGGIPLLRGCAATLQCRTRERIEAGDHVIFLGEVEALHHAPAPSLVYHRGRYAHAVAIGS